MGYYSDLAHNLQRKNERLKKENERAKVLLKATLDLLQKQKDRWSGRKITIEDFY